MQGFTARSCAAYLYSEYSEYTHDHMYHVNMYIHIELNFLGSLVRGGSGIICACLYVHVKMLFKEKYIQNWTSWGPWSEEGLIKMGNVATFFSDSKPSFTGPSNISLFFPVHYSFRYMNGPEKVVHGLYTYVMLMNGFQHLPHRAVFLGTICASYLKDTEYQYFNISYGVLYFSN